MTTPIVAATEWGAAQASPWTAHNESLRRLEAAGRRAIIVDRDLTAPPGTCADGACYIVGGSATGLWSGEDGKMAIAVGANAANGWLFVTVAAEGFEIYVQDENRAFRHDGSAWVGADPYDIPMSYAGGPPDADEIMYAVVTVRPVYFPADFAGSQGHVGIDPTASFVIDVRVDGVSIGSITISTAGAFTFATSGGLAVTVAAGALLEFVAPATPDASAAYILATLLAYI